MKQTIDETVCYSKAFHALGERKSLHSIVANAAEYGDAYIVILDTGGEVLAKSEDESKCEALSDVNFGKILIEALQEKKSVRMETNSEIVLVGVIEIRNYVEGLCVLCFDNQKENDDYIKFLDILCMTASLVMERDTVITHHHSNSSMRQIIAKNLFENDRSIFSNMESLNEVYEKYLTPRFLLAAIQPRIYDEYKIREMEKELEDRIGRKNLNSYFYEKGQVNYVLFSGVCTDEIQQMSEEILDEQMKKYNCVCGVSNLFDEINCLKEKKIMIEKVLQIGNRVSPECRIHFEKNLYIHVVCSYAADRMRNNIFMNEELDLLEEEDRGKDTEFYNTLREYLLTGNNVGATARTLFIHRNTMLYRLNKIGAIMKCDINNPEDSEKSDCQYGSEETVELTECIRLNYNKGELK